MTADGEVFTIVVKDGGEEVELYGPYRDEGEQEAYRRDWRDEGALEGETEVALRLTVRGAVEIETF